MSDVTADYLALREEAGAVELPRDVVRVVGPDALKFLQGQLSQNVDLAAGASAWAFVLQPQGKVDAFLRVTREGAESFLLDTDPGWGDAVTARLSRFKLRVQCEIEALEWGCVAVRGPRAHEAVAAPLGLADSGEGVCVNADWPGLPGVDILAESPRLPDGLRACSAEAYEAVRIEAGVPRMGSEIDERTIPAEAGVVDRSVSFTKGCFVGQELVARIDSRGGKVPRRLRGVVIATNVIPPVGARVLVEDKDVGVLTSVAESLERRAPVALAYVGRAIEPPADVTVSWDGGSTPATVEELPLVS
jgi:folate-binding protein YgfZ